MTVEIVYELPLLSPDRLGTAWCQVCGVGCGYLAAEVAPLKAWAERHRAVHGGAMSSSPATHGGRAANPGRDARIMELRDSGLSFAKIAASVGLSASGVQGAVDRLTRGAA